MKAGWHWLKRFPPYKVRLLARRPVSPRSKRVVALADEEVAAGGGIPLAEVRRIQHCKSWETVTVGDAIAFCRGCRFDPFEFSDRQRYNSYCRTQKCKWEWLHNSPCWEKTFRPLVKMMEQCLNQPEKH